MVPQAPYKPIAKVDRRVPTKVNVLSSTIIILLIYISMGICPSLSPEERVIKKNNVAIP